MIHISICDKENNYKGLFRTNSLADFMDDIVIGNDVQWFLDNCIDEETQSIIFSLNNIDLTKHIVDRLNFASCDCEMILFSDDEEITFDDFVFIGFDVCSDDYYFSPLGEGLIDCEVDDYKRECYDGFFEPLDFDVLQEYNDDINEFGLFSTEKTAQEIADYCNWLNEQDCEILDEEKDFRVVKIYAVK